MVKRKILFLVVFFVIIFLSVFLINNFKNKKNISQEKKDQNIYEMKALTFSAQCQDQNILNRKKCLSSKILIYLQSIPEDTGGIFDAFWNLAKAQKISDDPRIFSEMVHEEGMEMIDQKKTLDQSFEFCGNSFKQGCIHGAIMEYIDIFYPNAVNAKSLFELCQSVSKDQSIYMNCLHGIGHELAAKNKIPVEKLLSECDFSELEERSACASGLLMEYSKGTAGSGFHSHEPVGKIELPCEKVDEEFKSICYGSAGSYRQYEVGKEDFSSSYKFCFSVPEKYIKSCLLGLSDRAFMSTAGNQEKIDELCRSVNDEIIEKACLVSIQAVSELY